jgi:hypothetical protein
MVYLELQDSMGTLVSTTIVFVIVNIPTTIDTPHYSLGVCKRPATVAISAPEGYTFVFGDLAPPRRRRSDSGVCEVLSGGRLWLRALGGAAGIAADPASCANSVGPVVAARWAATRVTLLN